MVAPKNISTTNKNGEKPTTSNIQKKIVEPEGMMTIDLNSNEYILEEHKQLVRRGRKWEQLKYLSKLLCLLGSICMAIAIFMILAFLNKDYHFISSDSKNPNKTFLPSKISDEYVSQYIANLTQIMLEEKLLQKLDLDENLEIMTNCRSKKSLAECCKIFRELNNQQLIEICTAKDILKTFIEYELNIKRKKRQILPHNVEPPFDYGDQFFGQNFPKEYEVFDNFGSNTNNIPNNIEQFQFIENAASNKNHEFILIQNHEPEAKEESKFMLNDQMEFTHNENQSPDTENNALNINAHVSQKSKLNYLDHGIDPAPTETQLQNHDLQQTGSNLQVPDAEHNPLNINAHISPEPELNHLDHGVDPVRTEIQLQNHNLQDSSSNLQVPDTEHIPLNINAHILQKPEINYLDHGVDPIQTEILLQNHNLHESGSNFQAPDKEHNPLNIDAHISQEPELNHLGHGVDPVRTEIQLQNHHLQESGSSLQIPDMEQNALNINTHISQKLELNYLDHGIDSIQAEIHFKNNNLQEFGSNSNQGLNLVPINPQFLDISSTTKSHIVPYLGYHPSLSLSTNLDQQSQSPSRSLQEGSQSLNIPPPPISDLQADTSATPLFHQLIDPLHQQGMQPNSQLKPPSAISSVPNNNEHRDDFVLQMSQNHAHAPNIQNFILLPAEVQDLILNHVTISPPSIETRLANLDNLSNQKDVIVFKDENDHSPNSMEMSSNENIIDPRILGYSGTVIKNIENEKQLVNLKPKGVNLQSRQENNNRNISNNNFKIEENNELQNLMKSAIDKSVQNEVSQESKFNIQHYIGPNNTVNEQIINAKKPEFKESNDGKCASDEEKSRESSLQFSVDEIDSDLLEGNNKSDENIHETGTDAAIRNANKLVTSRTNLTENSTTQEKLEENVRENTKQSENFRPKAKLEAFATASEDVQSNQQTVVSPCFYPYMPPYMPPVQAGSPLGNNYLRVVQPKIPQQPLYVINPPMYYNIPHQNYMAPSQGYLPNYNAPVPQQIPSVHIFPPTQHQVSNTAQQYQQYNGFSSPIRVTGPEGQFYMCNPIPTPTSNIAGVSGVEIREATNLQTLMEEYEKRNESYTQTRARESILFCPKGEQACLDNTKCIKNYNVCDGEVHCDDASDEIVCNCKQRVGKLRLCDGYCDCPTCEDELGCFGCSHEELSCDDWSRYRRGTCIPKSQRCDNIKQCEITGKDEEGCSILTDHIGNHSLNIVSNSVGFLHRNYKGKWYPTCFGTEEWANEVCQIESGPSLISPRSHMTLTTDPYEGEFINILPNNEVSLVPTCIQDRAAFVECPSLYCGLRYLTKNPYRGEEVDTSIEDSLNDLERYTLGDEKMNNLISNDTNSPEYDFHDTETAQPAILEQSRIVGGKPSQPAAWPWLVSIYKNGIFHCGGVLINELWIVTAAHCVDRFWLYYYEIQAGSIRRFSFSPMDQTRIAKVAISHEFYSKANLKNDIALIKVSAPFRYNKFVRPICLPSESTAGADFLKGPSAGTKCTTVGWGATTEHGADPDHVREVEVPILSQCKHRDDNDGDEICAGLHEGGKDACQGDSGGPLMCRNTNNPNQWYLAGIVSHGEGCARPNEPGVYTRVSRYLAWIAEHTRENQLTLRTPLLKCPGFTCKGTKRCVPKKRHCDKIVDCLLGDDEINCKNTFTNLFKYSRNSVSDRKKVEFENMFINNMAEDIAPELSVIGSKHLLDDLNQTFTNMSKDSTIHRNKSVDESISYFKCTQLLQIIPYHKKCNKIIDCEDGTDELNCTCKDYVLNEDKSAVCDGKTDCMDMSDEISCLNCTSSEFACRVSQECIPLHKRCDGTKDCTLHEDEVNCAILSTGEFLTLDKDDQPTLLSKGVVTVNRNGTWKPLCLKNNSNLDNIRASTATKICNQLGFGEYISYHKYIAKEKEVVIMKNDDLKMFVQLNKTIRELCSDCCEGLYVSCSVDSFTSSISQSSNLSDSRELYGFPWTAVIFANGQYQCMGTMLNSRWIVTAAGCLKGLNSFKMEKHILTAVLGKGKLQLSVKGPHEQIVELVQNISVASNQIIIFRTSKNITFNRHAQPVKLDARRESLQKEKCYAVGMDSTKKVTFVNVFPIKNCLVGYRCFEAKQQSNCKYDQLWDGTIVCDSRNGWYPAAVFSSIKGPCGFSPDMRFISIKYYKNEIASLINTTELKGLIPAACNGFLCELGNCISKSKICDGVSDCQGNEDENPNLCYEKEHKCHLQDECECPYTHLKCPNNNKCFLKSSYCDRINNCGGYEDEPDVCSCRNYLKLTNPHKVCDGVPHCMDRSDEDPKICSCKKGDFPCSKNSNETAQCVPQSMVCDGVEDCPNGDDEKTCLSLNVENHQKINAGEVMSRTAGVWHSGCFSLNYTTSQLEDMCMKLGFTGGSASQLPAPRNLTSIEGFRPILDDFDGIWLRRTPGNRMRLRMRSGNTPYVNFLMDKECYRLFIACI